MECIVKYFRIILLVYLLQNVTSTLLIQAEHDEDNEEINYRLPKNIIPVSYKLFFNVQVESENSNFTGESVISINVKKSTDKIILHAKNLTITSLQMNCSINKNDKIIGGIIESIDAITDFLTINVNETLKSGWNCDLILKYKGIMNEEYQGFYRYVTSENKTEVVTVLDVIDARKVFPCFDEPAMKATFSISIEHESNYTVLSNMHELNKVVVDSNPERMVTNFAETPKMSAESVAFVITKNIQVGGKNYGVRVWGEPKSIEKCVYAQKIIDILMKTMENYTDISYSDHGFDKFDIVMTRQDQTASGNWGLATISESDLHFDKTKSDEDEEYLTYILGCIIIHQWFTNSVTMKWWNYDWMNSGFITYFSYHLIDKIQPSWQVKDRFVVDILQDLVFGTDSYSTTHPIERQIKNPVDLMKTSDYVTYFKSSCIIRMMAYVVGEENFQNSLRNYLKTNKFGSVTSDDLFREFKGIHMSNVNLPQIFRNWVSTPGYPLITVSRNYIDKNAIITQERFFMRDNETSNDRFWVAINFATNNDANFSDTRITHWFDPAKNSIEINGLKSDEFIIINKQRFGYYRVNYDDNNWKLIIKYMNSTNYKNIHVLNRAQLIDDASHLAQRGYINYNVLLSLLEYLKYEDEYIPWTTAWKVIAEIYKLTENSPFADDFMNYIRRISENLLTEVLSIPSDVNDYIMKLKKKEAIKSICLYVSDACHSAMNGKFMEWLSDPKNNTLTPDDEFGIICEGIRNADDKIRPMIWNKYLNTSDSKSTYILSCSPNITIMKKWLSMYMKNESYTDWILSNYESILDFPTFKQSARAFFDYIMKYYKDITKSKIHNSKKLGIFLNKLCEKIPDRRFIKKLVNFIQMNPNSPLNAAAKNSIKTIEETLKKYKRPLDEIQKFFQTKL